MLKEHPKILMCRLTRHVWVLDGVKTHKNISYAKYYAYINLLSVEPFRVDRQNKALELLPSPVALK